MWEAGDGGDISDPSALRQGKAKALKPAHIL
jgi:hypothetical protein